MMMPRPALLIVSLAALSLAGCASSVNGNYPSLAKRPIEERFAVVETAPLPPPGPLPADVAGRLAKWRADARAADAAFDLARGDTEAAVAAAGSAPVASETWVVGQQALSRLIVTRGPIVAALADVDALYIARQNADGIDGLPEIFALRTEMAAKIAWQNSVLAALAERLDK
jgi:hypothetical protein